MGLKEKRGDQELDLGSWNGIKGEEGRGPERKITELRGLGSRK